MIDTDDDVGMSPEDALFKIAEQQGNARDGLIHRDYVNVGARLAKQDEKRFKELLRLLGDWPSTRKFRQMVENRLAQLADKRPQIFASETDLKGTLDETEAALAAGAQNLFQMNGRLVQLVHFNRTGGADDCTEEEERIDSAAPIWRPSGALVIEDVSDHRLVELITESARWYKWDGRAKSRIPDPDRPGAYVRGKPSLEIAKHMQARGQWPALKVLRGSVEAPTLRATGSILQKAGYDSRSGLFFDDIDIAFPPVPKAPTREDGIAALQTLKDVVKDFPFVPDEGEDWGGPSAARSVALSAILTGLVRRTLRTAPAHGVDAPVMGSGKTKIGEIASVVVTGRTPTAISQGKTPEELNKRLFSVLRAGDPVIIIDNIEADVESDELCTVLTSELWQNRVLGLSKTETVATNALFVLNGNRMTFRGDITARVVVCNLDARMEDPRTRTFDREPVTYALEQRPELVVAGLTALRAHVVAGFPGTEDLVPSRFPDWDRMVRAALIWLGEPDPQATAEKVVTVDPVRDNLSALMRAWRDAIGVGVRVTCREVIERSEILPEEVDEYDWPETPWPDEAVTNLKDALSQALDGRLVDTLKLSKFLMKYEGRVYDGLTIHAKRDRRASNVFWLERT